LQRGREVVVRRSVGDGTGGRVSLEEKRVWNRRHAAKDVGGAQFVKREGPTESSMGGGGVKCWSQASRGRGRKRRMLDSERGLGGERFQKDKEGGDSGGGNFRNTTRSPSCEKFAKA